MFACLFASVLEWKAGNSIPRGRIISCIKTCKMIYKGPLYHIVSVKDFDSGTPPIELVPVVREFLEVPHNDLPGISLNGKLFLY